MSENSFQSQVLERLTKVEKGIHLIIGYLEDSKLTDEEKQLLEKSYEHEKENKVVSSKELGKRLSV